MTAIRPATAALLATLALLAGLTVPVPGGAHDYAAGALTIDHPYVLATPPNAPVAGGYLVVENAGPDDDRLVAVEVGVDVAGLVQLHEMAMDDGIMRMSEVPGGIEVPAGGAVTLERGGLHVMFMQLVDGLAAGDSFPATLVFERAGRVEVLFDVEARGAAQDHGAHGGHDD